MNLQQFNPLVSIIMPTYGRAHLLEYAIDSLLNQTYKNIEIVIVNDNKLDSKNYQNTMQILNKYKNTRVVIVADGKNVGGSLARNKGVEVSRGEYISFLDDDDYYYTEKIEKQLECIIKTNADVCVCNMDILKNGKIINNSKSEARVGHVADFLINGNCFTPMILLKRKSLIDVNGFTPAPRFQDHILILKLLKNNSKICTLKENLFVHNDHYDERVTKNALNSYEERWKCESELLYQLNEIELKKYNFNKMLNYTRVLRDNSLKIKSLRIHFLNILNITDFIQLKKYINVFVSIFLR